MSDLPTWYLRKGTDQVATSNYATVVKLKRQGWSIFRVSNDPFKDKPVPNPVKPPEPPPFTEEAGS